MLNELDIPKAMIDTELAAMTTHVVTKTANRSVVGMLNEFSFLGERFLAPDNDLHSLSIRLADTPCGPLYKSTSYPNSEVRLRLLGETPKWVKRKNEATDARREASLQRNSNAENLRARNQQADQPPPNP